MTEDREQLRAVAVAICKSLKMRAHCECTRLHPGECHAVLRYGSAAAAAIKALEEAQAK